MKHRMLRLLTVVFVLLSVALAGVSAKRKPDPAQMTLNTVIPTNTVIGFSSNRIYNYIDEPTIVTRKPADEVGYSENDLCFFIKTNDNPTGFTFTLTANPFKNVSDSDSTTQIGFQITIRPGGGIATGSETRLVIPKDGTDSVTFDVPGTAGNAVASYPLTHCVLNGQVLHDTGWGDGSPDDLGAADNGDYEALLTVTMTAK